MSKQTNLEDMFQAFREMGKNKLQGSETFHEYAKPEFSKWYDALNEKERAEYDKVFKS
jgi:hypothetical protein